MILRALSHALKSQTRKKFACEQFDEQKINLGKNRKLLPIFHLTTSREKT
jgi:hypothetical protein